MDGGRSVGGELCRRKDGEDGWMEGLRRSARADDLARSRSHGASPGGSSRCPRGGWHRVRALALPSAFPFRLRRLFLWTRKLDGSDTTQELLGMDFPRHYISVVLISPPEPVQLPPTHLGAQAIQEVANGVGQLQLLRGRYHSVFGNLAN